MRPVIVGMNNPNSDRPDTALLPYPRGSAGWRLWQMVHDVSGVSRHQWCRATERVNLVDGRQWDPLVASQRGRALWRDWVGRRVVVLGHSAREAICLPPAQLLVWNHHRGVDWCWAPHPSGLCRHYNSPLVRAVVGMRLEELISSKNNL